MKLTHVARAVRELVYGPPPPVTFGPIQPAERGQPYAE